MLGLVFSIPSEKIGLGKRLRNDLFCVEWDVKPQFSQSVQQNGAVIVQSCIFSVLVCCCIGANLEDCETVGIPPLMSRKTLGILDGGRGGGVDRSRRRRCIKGVDKGGANTIAGCVLLARTATNHIELKIFNAEEQQNNNRRPVNNYR